MSKADVRNYKLSRSHSTDQCVPESKSKTLLTRSRRFIVLLLSVDGGILKESHVIVHMNTLILTNKIISPLLHFFPSCMQRQACCSWRSGLYPVRALKFCEHGHEFSLHWHLLWEQQRFWDRRWMESEGEGGLSSYSWWMRNKWKRGSTDKTESCVRKQKQRVIRVCVEHSSSMRD